MPDTSDENALWVGPLLPDDHQRNWRRRHRIEAAIQEGAYEDIFNNYGDMDIAGVGRMRIECLEDDPEADPESLVLVDYEGQRFEVEIEVNVRPLPPLKPPLPQGDEAREPGPGQLALAVE